jgi:thymidylate synthase (FAD)
MPSHVLPQAYFIGYPTIDMRELTRYLKDSGNLEFLHTIDAARQEGVTDASILCSYYAKLCYDALRVGPNLNVSRVRDIPDNVAGTLGQGHGSVFEHAMFNFTIRNCSRVFTHECVRHRAGTAFSQTSGRYVRGDHINFVFDPILKPVEVHGRSLLAVLESVYLSLCDRMGLNGTAGIRRVLGTQVLVKDDKGRDSHVETVSPTDAQMEDFVRLTLGVSLAELERLPFATKKKVTSALRRYLPNGQANEIGFSLNVRAVRHWFMLRTAAGAEWEIRYVANQMFDLVRDRHPLLVADAKTREADGQREVYGMKLQPYDIVQEEPKTLADYSAEELTAELARRTA